MFCDWKDIYGSNNDRCHRFKGDEVVLIGSQNGNQISLEEVSSGIVGIPISVLCILTKKLPRIYIKSNKIEEVRDFINTYK